MKRRIIIVALMALVGTAGGCAAGFTPMHKLRAQGLWGTDPTGRGVGVPRASDTLIVRPLYTSPTGGGTLYSVDRIGGP